MGRTSVSSLGGIDTRLAFTVVVLAIAAQRLIELRVANRNTSRLVHRGGREVGARHYPWMVALHTAFLISCVAEVWIAARPVPPMIALVSLAVLVAAQGMRWWVLRTLGERWTTRVIVVPGERLVTAGPYRWLHHPNYLAVVLEIAAIPMLAMAWLTAVVFSVANLVLLGFRLAAEERALDAAETEGP